MKVSSVLVVSFWGLWLGLVLYFSSYWMGHHVFSYQISPEALKPLSALSSETHETWRLIHFLASDCDCSQDVLKYLLRSQREHIRAKAAREYIVWLGEPLDSKLSQALNQRGFQVLDGNNWKDAHLAVPSLVILNPRSQLVYAGGYRTEFHSKTFLDGEIFEKVLSGRPLSYYPIYGCLTSLKYQQVWNLAKGKN